MSLTVIIELGDDHIYANITHNLSSMPYALGIWKNLWGPKKPSSAGDLIQSLRLAISRMESEPEYYSTFNSPNGWGRFDNFLPWLKNLLFNCEQNENAGISIYG